MSNSNQFEKWGTYSRVKHFAISNEVFDLSEFILLADSK